MGGSDIKCAHPDCDDHQWIGTPRPAVRVLATCQKLGRDDTKYFIAERGQEAGNTEIKWSLEGS